MCVVYHYNVPGVRAAETDTAASDTITTRSLLAVCSSSSSDQMVSVTVRYTERHRARRRLARSDRGPTPVTRSRYSAILLPGTTSANTCWKYSRRIPHTARLDAVIDKPCVSRRMTAMKHYIADCIWMMRLHGRSVIGRGCYSDTFNKVVGWKSPGASECMGHQVQTILIL